ncbi:cobalamin ABC transporter substrate-binding protein [Oceanicola sp. 22II-s10i]|nr:cobalamin ABC transporter substrate-binding protein [Oceanicola sp. 22II-s10i]
MAILLALAGPVSERARAADAPPQRVVSMNLCTDQLAMMLAAPGQLVSVSHLAAEPRASAMAGAAAAGGYRLNHGRAEEIWLMEPDLVIAGSYSNIATVEMLRRLGVPVLVMEPAYGLTDIPDRLRRVGAALNRSAAAEAAATAFETTLSGLDTPEGDRPRAALYDANGYTPGERSLSGEIIAAAGFDNIAAEAGLPAGGHLPLELLAMAAPEAVISGRPYPGASRAEEVLDHPVVQMLREGTAGAVLTDRDWVCGTPHVLRAIADMRDLRRRMQGQ